MRITVELIWVLFLGGYGDISPPQKFRPQSRGGILVVARTGDKGPVQPLGSGPSVFSSGPSGSRLSFLLSSGDLGELVPVNGAAYTPLPVVKKERKTDRQTER